MLLRGVSRWLPFLALALLLGAWALCAWGRDGSLPSVLASHLPAAAFCAVAVVAAAAGLVARTRPALLAALACVPVAVFPLGGWVLPHATASGGAPSYRALTWNVEQQLVCPENRIGRIDLYQVTHHGADSSNNPVLVRSIRPRVAVINNGPRKGGAAQTYATLKATPSIEAIFQLHRNVATTPADNAPPEMVANPEAQCEGKMVRAEVAPNGRRYTVSVEGRDTSKTFAVW